MAPEYWLARLLFFRLLGVVYFIAFASTYNQFPALCGERGLLPASRHLRAAGFRRMPGLFHLHYSDGFARGVAIVGMVLSGAAALGVVERFPLVLTMLVWLALWFLYLSFLHAGQRFFGFVWETLLLEAGFLTVFLGNAHVAPLWPALLALRWLLLRLEVGAGLIKVRHDTAWRDLTALQYHHETQPIPNRFSWRFHNLPASVHRVEVAANHVVQLVVPLGLLLPQPFTSVAGAIIVVTQLWLIASGNFAWLNLLTITLAVTAFDNRFLERFLPIDPPSIADPPAWFTAIVVAMAIVMVVLAWKPIRNMASRNQVMNASYNRLHIGNSYGLFGRVTRERFEVVLEGTDDPHPGPASEWKAYEFKAKPGDPGRRPRQVAPYHLRLDWMMWFAAVSPNYAERWLPALITKLLEGDAATLKLIGSNPFREGPPRSVRALHYRYRFTTPAERTATRAWWHRELVGLYVRPVNLRTSPGAEEKPRASH